MLQRAWEADVTAASAEIVELQGKLAAVESELAGMTCPRCKVDGYWYRATKIAEELHDKAEAVCAAMRLKAEEWATNDTAINAFYYGRQVKMILADAGQRHLDELAALVAERDECLEVRREGRGRA